MDAQQVLLVESKWLRKGTEKRELAKLEWQKETNS